MSSKRRIIVSDESDEDDSFKRRRSSLRVNLSYSSKLSDSGNGSLGRTIQIEKDERDTDEPPADKSSRGRNVYERTSCGIDNDDQARVAGNMSVLTVSNEGRASVWIEKGIRLKRLTINLEDISAKEQALDTNCKRLKDAILSKTKEIFDKQDELSIKTTMVLASEKNRSARNVRDSSVDRSVYILDATTDRRSGDERPVIRDRRREDRHSDILATPTNVAGGRRNSEKAVDRSRLTPKRLFAEDRQTCRIIDDVILNKNLSISLKQADQESSPILSGSNRRLQLLRARSKLPPRSQFEDHNNTRSTVRSDCSMNIGPPLVCSTFIEDNAASEKGNERPRDNFDTTSLATRTTNKIISMEITKTYGGIRLSEKRTLPRDESPGTYRNGTESRENGESKDKSFERNGGIMSLRRLVGTPANKSIAQDDDVRSDVAHNDRANVCAETIVPAQAVSVEETALIRKETRKRGQDRADGQSVEKRRTLILSDSHGSDATRRSSLNVNTSLDALTEIGGAKNQPPRRSDVDCHGIIERDFGATAIDDKEPRALYDRRESSSTDHTSLRVNTSVDFVRRSTNTGILSFTRRKGENTRLGERSSIGDENMEDVMGGRASTGDRYSAKDKDMDDTDCLQNISLIERLRNISTRNRFSRNDKSEVVTETAENNERAENAESNDATSAKRGNGERENNNGRNSCNYIEATPYPVSRSVLFKSQLKHRTQNLNDHAASSSNINSTDEKDDDKTEPDASCPTPISNKTRGSTRASKTIDNTVILGDSSSSCNPVLGREKLTVIKDTLDETGLEVNERNTVTSKDAECIPVRKGRRRLFSLDENSQCSITPLENHSEVSEKSTPIKKKKKKLRKKRPQKKSASIKSDASNIRYNTAKRRTGSDDDCDISGNKGREEKKTRKPRKVVSKKIVIKKFADENVLNMLKEYTRTKEGNRSVEEKDSLDDFVACRTIIPTQRNKYKPQKIVIVTTGLSKGDKNLVKSIVKSLGMAEMELNVSRRTTHVVSTGVRTVNLLRGIIRGCWLITLEWVLKSLENNAWLKPEEFEMKHFSKSVMENRKDRQLFGPSYVPELFTACGLIHVEPKTTLPSDTLKELVKTAGGHITENPKFAKITVGANGLKETWVIDSITTGELQSTEFYQRK